MFATVRRHASVFLFAGVLLLASQPAKSASKTVDLDGDGIAESTVVLSLLQTWPPKIQNRVINNSSDDPLFNWLNAGPGGFRSRAPIGGESRWDWQTAQTVYSFTGTSCRNDMCTFNDDQSTLAGAFNVPGRTVVAGQITSSNASLTSSLIQSFSPGVTLLTCTSRVERLNNGNFGYTIECANDTGETVDVRIPAQPEGCCNGTDDEGQPNQIRCDEEVVVEEDDPETEEFDPVVAIESVCTDYLTDNENCGSCGNVCGLGETCELGACTSICGENEAFCVPEGAGEPYCSDLSLDPENCGACGTVCEPTLSTSGPVDSICVPTEGGDVAGECEFCPLSAPTRCGNECIDLDSDADNCGECGHSCEVECGGPATCEDNACSCAGASAPLVEDPGFGETLLVNESKTQQRKPIVPAIPKGLPVVEPPSPQCESDEQILTIPTGGTIRECTASPYLPKEVTGSIILCGGLIPSGSPLCAGTVGTSGVFQRFEPSDRLPSSLELSMIGLRLDDGDGLIQAGETVCMTVLVENAGTEDLTSLSATLTSEPVDLDCGLIQGSTCIPEQDNLATVNIVQAESAYPDLPGIGQGDPDNTSCEDVNGDPLPPAGPAYQGSNLTEFCVEIPSDHPGDLVRPFEMEFVGLDGQGKPFIRRVPFALGIASACEFGPGAFPDGLSLEPPLAPLVPVEDPPMLAGVPFTAGEVLPLGIRLTCGGANLTGFDVEYPPRIVALRGDTVGSQPAPPDAFAYDPATGLWMLDLPTDALPSDFYELRIRISDTKDYHTRFQICGDADLDGTNDCIDECPEDAGKIVPGTCGCGVADTDTDGDGTLDCNDQCPEDAGKIVPGTCGCGVADTDTDGDGAPDCIDPCGNGVVEPGEECDDGNAVNGDGCSATCLGEGECALAVSKTCYPLPDDYAPHDCHGQLTAIKLQYTGDGCGASTNPQGGRATCDGGADGAEPVSIRVTDVRGNKVFADEAMVSRGDIFAATAANAGETKFGAQTIITIDDGLETITLHSNCLKPLRVGDRFGSIRLVEVTSTQGGTVSLPDRTPGEGLEACVIPPPPAGPHCDGKVQSVRLRYVGGSCLDSAQQQGDKFECSGSADVAQPVRIVCTKDGDPGRVFLDTGDASVMIGDEVLVAGAYAGRAELFNRTTCTIRDDLGTWLQELTLETGCSRPLDLADRFGSLLVTALDTTKGGFVRLEHDVVYTYDVTNVGPLPAVGVSVIDDQLGELPGSPIEHLAPGETRTFQTLAPIGQDTTNVVTVGGSLEDGQVCPPASDSATVRLADPPRLPETCRTEIRAVRLEYDGPDIAEPVTLEIRTADGTGLPVRYDFPRGLKNGTVPEKASENGYTIDAAVHGLTGLGPQLTLSLAGREQTVETGCDGDLSDPTKAAAAAGAGWRVVGVLAGEK